MTYVGNDIVSLRDLRNVRSFTRARYLAKVLTKPEMRLVKKRRTINAYLPYLIWACKESAYKIMVKKGLRDAFCPVMFKVNTRHLANALHASEEANAPKNFYPVTFSGSLVYKHEKIYTQSIITDTIIHTVASNVNLSSVNVISGTEKTKELARDSQSDLCRNLFKQSLQQILGIDPCRISITKSVHEVPSVYIDNVSSLLDLSFSHDDEFVSYAYLLNEGSH